MNDFHSWVQRNKGIYVFLVHLLMLVLITIEISFSKNQNQSLSIWLSFFNFYLILMSFLLKPKLYDPSFGKQDMYIPHYKIAPLTEKICNDGFTLESSRPDQFIFSKRRNKWFSERLKLKRIPNNLWILTGQGRFLEPFKPFRLKYRQP